MARTKAQILQAKRRKAAQAALRSDQHRHVRERKAKPEDPRKTALDARVRMLTRPKGDPSMPIYGHPCGVAIDALADNLDEALALWELFDRIDKADAAYCRHVLGRRRFAKTAKLELLPEKLETSADAPAADLRSDDEKHRDAQNGWARWTARLSRLSAQQRLAITDTLRGVRDPIRDGKVTRAGRDMVDGIRAMVDRKEGVQKVCKAA